MPSILFQHQVLDIFWYIYSVQLCLLIFWGIFKLFGSVVNLFYNIPLTQKLFKEALENVINNVLELKSESPIRNNLNLNDCERIEDLVITTDEDIPDLRYQTYNK